ncbi:aminoglycoside phosphotransferase family protein [Acetobacter malorum]|uniref:aminoglycoside phosphotransferase family protein n=1 Tax=Acetobacter malorum TaxID=178901 RepID=UPI0015C51A4C|nr:aminoglycoside phosphotransferase family protein [Acetobacter malorum]
MRAVSSWNGQGVAAVLEHDRDAFLERAVNGRNLADLVYAGLDDEPTRNLCKTAELLHSAALLQQEEMRSLKSWFAELLELSLNSAEWLNDCAGQAHSLSCDPQEQLALHGDLHHGNVLDLGARG